MTIGLSQLLGLTANAEPKIYPRQVSLSGNIFHFSMPENFSKDMPAANMIEILNIENLQKFDNPEYGNIIRRWWDIKKPGFFGKELGTVMMDISIQRIPKNKKKVLSEKTFNITNRLDFMMMINEQLHNRFDQLNREIEPELPGTYAYYFSCCSLLGEKILSNYRDHIYGNQKWLGYSVAAPLNQLIAGRALPINKNSYLEVIFTYSPNQNVPPREFQNIAHQTTQPIENSFKVDYLPENEIKNLVEKAWLNKTNDEVMNENYNAILVPLFGANIHQEIEEGKRSALEWQKEMNKPLEE
ncbi:hypothetical protein [Cellvibrio sp. BR]|uniref:hypothetical protein n=1 Tax=Cellvibrio sp. BR TaxID=1134474 RepID=UPI00058E600D|nr:hypothetical protein [Cellvibrio sp. BR]